MKQQLGPYQLIERLGVGGMAEVFLAHARRHGDFVQPCVVKILHDKLARDPGFTRMLLEEARLIARLRHNNIASLYDVGRQGDKVFLVMEYVEGQDLHSILAKAVRRDVALPVAFALHVARSLCAGLHFAHTRRGPDGAPLRLIHRDISPPNVLVSNVGEVKLIDFGVAKFDSTVREKTRAGVIKGKFGYMSPEQAWDEPLDHRSDLFAVGICLYEMLSGRSLYGQDDDATVMLQRARQADIERVEKWRSDVPAELANLIHRALDRDRKRRFQSAHDMERQLSTILSQVAPDYTGLDAGALIDDLFGTDEPALQSWTGGASAPIESQQAEPATSGGEKKRGIDESTAPIADVPQDLRADHSLPRDDGTPKTEFNDVSDEATVNLTFEEDADFSQEATELFDEQRISGAQQTLDTIDRDATQSLARRAADSRQTTNPPGRDPALQTRQIENDLEDADTDPRHGTPQSAATDDEPTYPRNEASLPALDDGAADDEGEFPNSAAPWVDEPGAEVRPSPGGTSPVAVIGKERGSVPRRASDDSESSGSWRIDRPVQIALAALFVVLALVFVLLRFL